MSRTGHVKLLGNGGADVRLTDRISLGVLSDVVPRDFIEDVLNRTGRREQRSRLLPAHVMVRFCMAMCLFFDDDYEEVMRKLVGSLKDMRSWSDSWHVPSTSAITQARQRLGAEPLRELFEDIAVPVAGPGTKGAWLRSWRLMSIDGCALNIPDTAANVAEFDRSNNGPNASAYPIVRVVGLGECGSHVLVDAALGGAPAGETTLAKELTRSFEADMLITADRSFYSFPAWQETLETGADALWRVKSNLLLPVARVLPDGSYLSAVFPPKLRNYHKKEILTRIRDGAMPHTTQAMVVRVVEYEIPDRERTEEHDTIRLITSILDPEDIPAIELATAYSERWEYESLLDEVKTHQRGPGRVLRSQSPEMVKQEIWALLLTHYSIRALMCRAADEADVDPDRLSFMRTLRVIRRQVTSQAAFSPSKTEKGTRGDDD
ncbi:IS4 family transposase [Amycolatopsis sp. NBC_00345]